VSLDAIGGPAGAWLALALVLGIAELLIPGVFLVFIAIAAAITGIATWALPDLNGAVQIGSFAVWSVVTVLIGRRWYSDYPVGGGDVRLNDRAGRMIGEVVTVEVAIVDGHGRVRVGDGSWPARGPDAAAGTRVRVVRVDGGVALVAMLPPQ
jgi:membrane protein implicated in regulation of membrane protease activity